MHAGVPTLPRWPMRGAARRGDAGALARAEARDTDGAAEDMAAAAAHVPPTALTGAWSPRQGRRKWPAVSATAGESPAPRT